MIDIETIEEYICTGSLSYGAVTTYESELFEFRTGPNYSVMTMNRIGDELTSLLFKGSYRVDSDEECWDLIFKFRKSQLSELVLKVAEITGNRCENRAVRELQKDLRQLLGLQTASDGFTFAYE
jgi:hypothetical protein